MSKNCCKSEPACCVPSPLAAPTKTVTPTVEVTTCGTVADSCCPKAVPVFDGVDPRYKRVLWTVIVINGAMFLTEMAAGQLVGSLLLMALWVFGSTVYHTLILGVPQAEIMGAIGVLALAANLASVLLLLPYKDGDANVRSVWLCSRNDAIGNLIVMGAALGVWITTSAWPDFAVAAIMAGIFLSSAVQILRQTWGEYRTEETGTKVAAA